VIGEGGTGKRAQLQGVRVGGKTGTAQKLDPATGRYTQDKYVAWFIGVAPLDAPRVAIAVGIDEPKGAHTGGAVAAPVFARVAAVLLTQMGVATEPLLDPSGRPAVRSAANAPTPAPPLPAVAAAPPLPPGAEIAHEDGRLLVPDLHGKTVAEVKQITAGVPIELELYGHGRAVAQEPDPGTVLSTERTRLRVRFAEQGERG